MHTIVLGRDVADTDTASTDSEYTCGGLGKFEYSSKVMPHALLHMTELVMRGGHHGAFCTFLAEVAHKYNIKIAAKLARTYGSHNTSQHEMLQLVLTHEIYEEAILLSSSTADVQQDEEEEISVSAPNSNAAASDASDINQARTDDNDDVKRIPVDALFYFQDWSQISDISTVWEGKFLSGRVRVTNLYLCFETHIRFLIHKCVLLRVRGQRSVFVF